jgi:hypothetical protein
MAIAAAATPEPVPGSRDAQRPVVRKLLRRWSATIIAATRSSG